MEVPVDFAGRRAEALSHRDFFVSLFCHSLSAGFVLPVGEIRTLCRYGAGRLCFALAGGHSADGPDAGHTKVQFSANRPTAESHLRSIRSIRCVALSELRAPRQPMAGTVSAARGLCGIAAVPAGSV